MERTRSPLPSGSCRASSRISSRSSRRDGVRTHAREDVRRAHLLRRDLSSSSSSAKKRLRRRSSSDGSRSRRASRSQMLLGSRGRGRLRRRIAGQSRGVDRQARKESRLALSRREVGDDVVREDRALREGLRGPEHGSKNPQGDGRDREPRLGDEESSRHQSRYSVAERRLLSR